MNDKTIDFCNPSQSFYDYSAAYIVTNEDLRWINSRVSPAGADVLSVAASGDHPLFYKLAGARHVDTFDISYCAKVIMDIKCAAMMILNRDEYVNMLGHLYTARRVSDIAHMRRVIDYINPETRAFIQEHDTCKMFGHGIHPRYYADTMLTHDEYDALKSNGPHRFDFMHIDLNRVAEKLNRMYEIINLSNIFEHETNIDVIRHGICRLSEHLNPGGVIIVQHSPTINAPQYNIYAQLAQDFKSWATVGQLDKPSNGNRQSATAIILHKNHQR